MQFSQFDPLVAEWFQTRFEAPTEPQLKGWEQIASGNDVLISAPTGSGKTLTAFLISIDQLVKAARNGNLPDETQVVYISPLKALSTDIHKNLEVPLREIAALAQKKNIHLSEIRTAVRTGDTPAAERQKITKVAPHILVTTPESLYIMATAEKSRQMLSTVRTIIVDEIHAIADDKRGSHLSLTLARIHSLIHRKASRAPQYVGLSATVRPLELIGKFLSPHAKIVNVGHRRDMDLSIEVPDDELSSVATSEMWEEIYDRITSHILKTRTTLVFVNTRRMSERVSHALAKRLGEEAVLPHHGSLSRALRHKAETLLKNGNLKAVVATASLELGIDIGTVDLAIQIGTPRSIAVALQRIGRSGHWVGAKPKGIFFPTTRDELIECSGLIYGIHTEQLEHLEIPENAVDILAQQIVAETAAETWDEDELFHLIRSAYPYRNLPRQEFNSIIRMLADGITTTRARSGMYLHYDEINHRLKGRRGARLAAITSGGAIPETGNYSVIAEPDGKVVGNVDEDFAVESMTGDIFLLGTTSWRVRHVGQGVVRVEDAQGAQPSVPFWLGEAPGRSLELSACVSDVRAKIAETPSQEEIFSFLKELCGLDEAGAKQAVAYVQDGVAGLGALPSMNTVVAERFFDESGGMQLVIHAPFGSRVNRAWGLSLRKRFCVRFNFELQAAATDNGIIISLSEQHAFPLESVFEFLHSDTVEHVLREALITAPMFGSRWRWNLTRSLAVLRFMGGKKLPAPIQRMRSEDLLAAVFPDQVACAENLTGPIRIPDHPLVNETISNCLHEAMDINGLRKVIQGMEEGTIRKVAVENPAPSVFSHEILNANPYAFLDDAPLEERRARAVQIRSSLRTDISKGAGILDPEAIHQVAHEVWPDPRDADELHDSLLSLIILPAEPAWEEWFQELVDSHRAIVIHRNDTTFWVAAERTEQVNDTLAIIRGWMDHLGPVTATELSSRLAIPLDDVRIALATLEVEGQIFEGYYLNQKPAEIEWCNRRILARIHRLTLGQLRREIEPITAAQFHQFLQRWQHLAHGSQLHGADGLLQIIRQLQTYEIPASSWESDILSRRMVRYTPEDLDELCLSGEIMWARLSPHPALITPDRRVRPTRIAPITFFRREDADWLLENREPTSPENLSHPGREVMDFLSSKGASFFGDLVRGTKRLPSEVEDALWELTAAGLVTADGFENLRALIDPKRRRGEGRTGRRSRPRHATGRWAILNRHESTISKEKQIQHYASQLLLRWGVLFRDLLKKETVAPPWRELLPVLRRMEAQGEIRGGRFVSGFTGEQFAKPEAIDLIRSIRKNEQIIVSNKVISPTDPLNLFGILLPGVQEVICSPSSIAV